MATIIFSRKFPERPTKGRPCSSSFAPGASPINIISGLLLPCPGTVLVRVLASEHCVQLLIFKVIASISAQPVAFTFTAVAGLAVLVGVGAGLAGAVGVAGVLSETVVVVFGIVLFDSFSIIS